MTILLALLPDAGHDQLWLLLSAQRMHGLDPYGPQGFESNPPLAIWLSAIPVALARWLHLPLTLVFKSGVIAIAVASAFVSAKLLRRLLPSLTRHQLWALGIAFVLIFGAVPARDFGQRDHILTLLILPYLLAAGVRVSTASRLAVTLAAALGLALKPHQSLIAVAVELTLFFTVRRIRLLEPAVFLACGAGYLVAIRTLAPTYFSTILPILRDTYWAFGQLSLPQLLLAAIGLLILAAVTLLLCRRPANRLIPILLAAASAATLGYLLQGTGWYYQQLPAISLFALALTLQLTQKIQAPHLAPEMWAGPWLPSLAGEPHAAGPQPRHVLLRLPPHPTRHRTSRAHPRPRLLRPPTAGHRRRHAHHLGRRQRSSRLPLPPHTRPALSPPLDTARHPPQ